MRDCFGTAAFVIAAFVIASEAKQSATWIASALRASQ
jgi:hypothetical protein